MSDDASRAKALALKVRLAGWAISLTGLAVIAFVGNMDMKRPGTWVGTVVFFLGMICTSASNLIAGRIHIRRPESQVEPLTPESADRAREFIRKRVSRPDPERPSSPPSPPSRQD